MKKSKFDEIYNSFNKMLNDSEIDEQEGCDCGGEGSSVDSSNDTEAGVDISVLKPMYEFPPNYALNSKIMKNTIMYRRRKNKR